MSSDARSARWAWLAVLGLSVFIAAFAIGCGGDDSTDSTSAGGDMLSEVGKGEGELNLICWASYCEDGSTDPDVDWISVRTPMRRPRDRNATTMNERTPSDRRISRSSSSLASRWRS